MVRIFDFTLTDEEIEVVQWILLEISKGRQTAIEASTAKHIAIKIMMQRLQKVLGCNGKSESELIEIAKQINRCFDNGCGCCSVGDDDLKSAVEILRELINS